MSSDTTVMPKKEKDVLSVPVEVKDTGLGKTFIRELALKTLYQRGDMMAGMLADALELPYAGIIEDAVEYLRKELLVEVTGSGALGRISFQLSIVDAGRVRARELMARCAYVGAAPITLDAYQNYMDSSSARTLITKEAMDEAFEGIILDREIVDALGPAANSGRSIFLYGNPGNGKTIIAEGLTRAVGGYVYVPYAIIVDGEIIKVYDPFVHNKIEDDGGSYDTRWVKCERPTVVVGGELTLETLDLIYHESARYYEAPFQLKANGGTFLIDDFGRQRVRPEDLLNRWIVPLEKMYDFLTLSTGMKIQVPFTQMILFSTNLDPNDLVDDAFLRRIRYKIEIGDPNLERFTAIFEGVCKARGIQFVPQAVDYLMERHYKPANRPLRCCQPRDLLDQVIDHARYLNKKPVLSEALLDAAAKSYFVDLSGDEE